MGQLSYWQHRRSGELHAVELTPDGHVLRCTWPLHVAELGRLVRADLRAWPELCARLERQRADYRTVGEVQIALALQQSSGALPAAAGAWPIVLGLGSEC